MIRTIFAAVALAACPACSADSAIDRELVCSVTTSPAYAPVPEGGAAWDWPAAAQEEIDKAAWTDAEEGLIRSCGQGMQPKVVGLKFSSDRKLALITRSSFERAAEPETDPEMEAVLELSGSIESCLLRRETVLSSRLWQPLACKLDAVS